jgi:hypothetical protein
LEPFTKLSYPILVKKKDLIGTASELAGYGAANAWPVNDISEYLESAIELSNDEPKPLLLEGILARQRRHRYVRLLQPDWIGAVKKYYSVNCLRHDDRYSFEGSGNQSFT